MTTAIIILLILTYLYGGLYMLHTLGTDHFYEFRTDAGGTLLTLFFLIFWLPIMVWVYFTMYIKGES